MLARALATADLHQLMPPPPLPPGEWLSAKDKRLSTEAKTQAHLQKVRGPRCC